LQWDWYAIVNFDRYWQENPFSADQFREDPRARHLPDLITPSEYGVGDCPPTYNSPSITFSCFDIL